jgi:hypothetical protein
MWSRSGFLEGATFSTAAKPQRVHFLRVQVVRLGHKLVALHDGHIMREHDLPRAHVNVGVPEQPVRIEFAARHISGRRAHHHSMIRLSSRASGWRRSRWRTS